MYFADGENPKVVVVVVVIYFQHDHVHSRTHIISNKVMMGAPRVVIRLIELGTH